MDLRQGRSVDFRWSDPEYLQKVASRVSGILGSMPPGAMDALRQGHSVTATLPKDSPLRSDPDLRAATYLHDALAAHVQEPPSVEELKQWIQGNADTGWGTPLSVQVFAPSDEDLAAIAAFVNGHSMAVAQNASSGGGVARLLGVVAGATIGGLVTGGTPEGILAGAQTGAAATS